MKRAADIMNYLDSSVEGPLMDAIRDADQDLSGQIEDLMFVFDNLADVDDRGIQALLREVSSDVWCWRSRAPTTASRRSSSATCPSARRAAARRLEAKGPVRLSEVEGAQKEVPPWLVAWPMPARSFWGGKGGEEMV